MTMLGHSSREYIAGIRGKDSRSLHYHSDAARLNGLLDSNRNLLGEAFLDL